YLDERFPHPPLLPVYPVARAQSRLWMYRIERDWAPLINNILFANESAQAAARKDFRDNLMTIAPIFSEKPFFMSDEFTLVDCVVAPILWRLPVFKIELPEKQCKGLFKYMDRLFSRETFQASLSDAEREMR
ncbi:MAG TPA: glutathione binding-like protein, partial [Pseudomonadales bacterium]|nr:glutathione binding-like protein [Pseudomonadales bacterium]